MQLCEENPGKPVKKGQVYDEYRHREHRDQKVSEVPVYMLRTAWVGACNNTKSIKLVSLKSHEEFDPPLRVFNELRPMGNTTILERVFHMYTSLKPKKNGNNKQLNDGTGEEGSNDTFGEENDADDIHSGEEEMALDKSTTQGHEGHNAGTLEEESNKADDGGHAVESLNNCGEVVHPESTLSHDGHDATNIVGSLGANHDENANAMAGLRILWANADESSLFVSPENSMDHTFFNILRASR